MRRSAATSAELGRLLQRFYRQGEAERHERERDVLRLAERQPWEVVRERVAADAPPASDGRRN